MNGNKLATNGYNLVIGKYIIYSLGIKEKLKKSLHFSPPAIHGSLPMKMVKIRKLPYNGKCQ